MAQGGGSDRSCGTGEEKRPSSRAIQVGLRTIHITAMGLVLGGIAMGGTHDRLLVPIVVTVATGVLLLAVMLAYRTLSLRQGAGWALFLKLGLLGLGNLLPARRLEFYVAATVVTSIASHMPGSWRHFTLPGRFGTPARD
jgi:hypothetical protein